MLVHVFPIEVVMKRQSLVLVLLAALLPGQERVDEAAVEYFRAQGLDPANSQVMQHLSSICDVYGPRLTASPNIREAQRWARDTFVQWGLQNVALEKWGPFGRGWSVQRSSMSVVGDNPWPVIAYPKAWSPALGKVEGDVVDADAMTADQLRAADLAGKVVLVESLREVEEPFEGPSRRFDAEDLLEMADQRSDVGRQSGNRAAQAVREAFRAGFQKRRQMMEILADKAPLALIDRGFKGDYGTVFVSGATALPGPDGERVRASAVGARVLPQFTMAVEHYNRICRLVGRGLPVRLSIELETTFHDEDLHCHNVVAELPGQDPEQEGEVVMLGAHFDSWHTGCGTTDNGCGSAVVMEAMRLLVSYAKVAGAPRRTIRIALWSGEEQGLLGSKAYVDSHFGTPEQPKDAQAKVSAYYNLDNGTGRIRGVYLQGNEAVAPIFRAWLRPFHDVSATTLTLNDTGGTDHLSFDRVGIPGFQFIQDPVSYSTRTHHSNMDVYDHAVADDLRQAATVMASFVWHTAQRDGMLPRK